MDGWTDLAWWWVVIPHLPVIHSSPQLHLGSPFYSKPLQHSSMRFLKTAEFVDSAGGGKVLWDLRSGLRRWHPGLGVCGSSAAGDCSRSSSFQHALLPQCTGAPDASCLYALPSQGAGLTPAPESQRSSGWAGASCLGSWLTCPPHPHHTAAGLWAQETDVGVARKKGNK